MKTSSGFTMLELLITLTIVGVFAAIAIPSMNYVTTANRVATEVNSLLGDMQYARTEAVKEGLPITVCISTNGTSCAIASTTWQSGWIVFADSNGNHVVDPGEAILRTQNAFTGTDTFVANNAFGWATFNREGFATTGAVTTVLVTLHNLTNTSQFTRCLTITPVGMLQVIKVGVTATGGGVCS